MSEPTTVTRSVDVDLPADELWSLVTDGDAWATWMVDEADVIVTPGAHGSVVDDGVARTVRVDRLDDDGRQQRLELTWWPDDRPDLASAVELVVLPTPIGSRLLVTETRARATTAGRAWDLRLLLLAVRALAVAV